MPLMPNDETPARAGRSAAGHGSGSVSSRTAPASQSTWEVGASTCRVRGTVRWRIAMTILITPATPAAAWVCPMLDLTEPRYSGVARSCPYVASSACASIGSPSVVPVPCASTTSTSRAARPADARAWRMTRCCDGPFGAVSPLDAPSELTAEPRTTASTLWPFLLASESFSTTSTPTPSAQPVPSAASANALQRPSGARPPCRVKPEKPIGVAITVTPPASASEHSPLRSACAARCSATSDDEHAVSTVSAGPSSPRAYDTRPEMTLAVRPVVAWPSASSREPITTPM
ncbi:hypothetical protein Adi01nite_39190 [Amorphoplanes digitatis]|nr:hypothetical protein Adi01nite_39190 [Actinoplanes digitatis]